MNIFVKSGRSGVKNKDISIRCPACRQVGMFYGYQDIYDLQWWEPIPEETSSTFKAFAGLRICPNMECEALVFAAINPQGKLVTFPPEVLDFDGKNLPPLILASLEEAVKCHAAGCYRASALMVRRVLEELCEDKGAIGKNLKDRIAGLNSAAVIPSELLSAADELRLLGNDAAHIEAKSYDQICANECEIAIELAKELLKAVYQYTSLVDRLKALKKPNP